MFPCADLIPAPPVVYTGEWLRPVVAFVLTVLIEWPLLAWWSGRGLRRTAAFSLVMNGTSWGLAMGVSMLFEIPVPLLEGGIVLVEGALLLYYLHWPRWRALLTSLGLNLASWVLGELLLLFLRL